MTQTENDTKVTSRDYNISVPTAPRTLYYQTVKWHTVSQLIWRYLLQCTDNIIHHWYSIAWPQCIVLCTWMYS